MGGGCRGGPIRVEGPLGKCREARSLAFAIADLRPATAGVPPGLSSHDDALVHQFRRKGGMLMNPSPIFAFVRFMMIFFIGVAAAVAWQSYGAAAREVIASWSRHLAWLAPAAAPAGTSAERLKTTSLALAAPRQSFDKLTTEISKLHAPGIPDPQPRSPP